jgi:HEAT repeat protein
MIRIGSLLKDLHSNDNAAGMDAIRSLGQMGLGAASAIPGFVALLDDPDKDIACLSLRALALVGPNRLPKPKIVERLRDPCPATRRMAAFAIGAMGTAGRDVIPLVLACSKMKIEACR